MILFRPGLGNDIVHAGPGNDTLDLSASESGAVNIIARELMVV